jgi:hypothetical protein
LALQWNIQKNKEFRIQESEYRKNETTFWLGMQNILSPEFWIPQDDTGELAINEDQGRRPG